MKKIFFALLATIACIAPLNAQCLKSRVIKLEKDVKTLAGAERTVLKRLAVADANIDRIAKKLPAIAAKRYKVVRVENTYPDEDAE